jgi:hypothetical protein
LILERVNLSAVRRNFQSNRPNTSDLTTDECEVIRLDRMPAAASG